MRNILSSSQIYFRTSFYLSETFHFETHLSIVSSQYKQMIWYLSPGLVIQITLWFWSASTLLNTSSRRRVLLNERACCERAVHYPRSPPGVFTVAMLCCVLWKVMMAKGTGTLHCLLYISDIQILGWTDCSLCLLALVCCCWIEVYEWFTVAMRNVCRVSESLLSFH